MRKLTVFDRIEFEVEHPLYLTRVQQVPTGRTTKVLQNEFERKEVPVFAIQVKYLPKFERTSMTGGDITTPDQAYRVLYEVAITVGESHLPGVLNKLTGEAQYLATHNPDPAQWKEDPTI